jgi:hypothetical protein
MKILVDKGSGFVIDGETDHPEAIQKLQERFLDFVDAAGDLVFSEDDLTIYYGELIPFLKATGNRRSG